MNVVFLTTVLDSSHILTNPPRHMKVKTTTSGSVRDASHANVQPIDLASPTKQVDSIHKTKR
jgi:hypothetical protein